MTNRERAQSLALYLVMHEKGQVPVDIQNVIIDCLLDIDWNDAESRGWNEAIEAAAKEMENLLDLPKDQIASIAGTIRALKGQEQP